MFKGAVFSDAGNFGHIKRILQTNAEFNFKRFGKEIALCGAGLRLDLSFFVINLISLFQFDPSYTSGAKWVSDIIDYRRDYFNQSMRLILL